MKSDDRATDPWVRILPSPPKGELMKKCLVCGKNLTRDNVTGYCLEHYREHLRQEKLNSWLDTGKTGYTVDTTIRGVIRDYIFDRQNGKCAICGIPAIWNNQDLHFVLDHIDGDASNSSPDNLRLVCPNCDSQLDTFKSRNKDSARNARKEFLKDNLSKQTV